MEPISTLTLAVGGAIMATTIIADIFFNPKDWSYFSIIDPNVRDRNRIKLIRLVNPNYKMKEELKVEG